MGKLHSSVFSGHLGVAKTIERANERIWWPFYQVDIVEFIKACENCQKIKRGIRFNPPMKFIKASRPLQLITMDDAGPLPKSKKGNVYIQLIVDHFTKLLRAFPKADNTAKKAAKIVLAYMMVYGVAEQILTDQGANFEAELMDELMDLLDIRKVRSSAYYPQGDGQSEVMVRTIKQMISAFVAEAQDDWDEKLDELCFAYNTATHAATKITPMEAMFHRPIKVPLDIFYKAVELTDSVARQIRDLDLSFEVGGYVHKVKDELQEMYKLISTNRDVRM